MAAQENYGNKIIPKMRKILSLISISVLILFAVFIFVNVFFMQSYKIPTTSMVPTLMPGDKIAVNKIIYGPRIPFLSVRLPGLKKPDRGEVIVFISPADRTKAYIKRLIASSGERLSIKDGNVYVNGKIMVDPRIARNYYYNQGEYAKSSKEIVVPEGKYFFMGDNSISSLDSRFWGFVDKKDIVGKAIFIWWPPKRVGMIE